ncbi:hypothetical protein ACC696_38560, partial [Rhizobium ruizarguesonis]
MMKPDLIQAMLSHFGNDLYYIDTVDKAGRFEIELFGGCESTGLTEAQAYYACENGFHSSRAAGAAADSQCPCRLDL